MDTVDIIFMLLKQQDKTQQELANAIGVSKYKISEWKARKTASYMKSLDEIASFFGVTVDYLLGSKQKNSSSEKSEELSKIEHEIIAIYRNLPEEKKKAFMTIVESLKSPPKDK